MMVPLYQVGEVELKIASPPCSDKLAIEGMPKYGVIVTVY